MANENGNNQLATINTGAILPSNADEQIMQAKQILEYNEKLLHELLKEKVDFDRIPGTERPTLLKPGAEMLCKVYGLSKGDMKVTDKTEDWEHGIFCYTVTCPLVHIASGNIVAVGMGAANSYEVKYRYRNKYDDETHTKTRTENADPADNINTLIKMAAKRAFVDAVLNATCASRIFTQDLEEFKSLSGGSTEPASSAQIKFIRMLANGDLNLVKNILGREITKLEEIYRSEASTLIDKLKAQASSGDGYGGYGGYNAPPADYNPEPPEGYGAPPPAANNAASFVCADCGKKITNAENGYSLNKFGRALCRDCQNKERKGA